ncbi:MAG: hypothetical protein V8Q27_03515 [Eubacteriales bacterium]
MNSTVIKKINMNESVILISLSGETRKIVEVGKNCKSQICNGNCPDWLFFPVRLDDWRIIPYIVPAENADTRENDINSRLGMFVSN